MGASVGTPAIGPAEREPQYTNFLGVSRILNTPGFQKGARCLETTRGLLPGGTLLRCRGCATKNDEEEHDQQRALAGGAPGPVPVCYSVEPVAT